MKLTIRKRHQVTKALAVAVMKVAAPPAAARAAVAVVLQIVNRIQAIATPVALQAAAAALPVAVVQAAVVL